MVHGDHPAVGANLNIQGALEDLYGYSVLEVETGRTMHYIPEKSWPLDGRQGEETSVSRPLH